MTNIIVNISNTQYQSVTNDKGDIGIGTPFTTTTNESELEFTRDSIQSKYEKLVELQEAYKNASLTDMRTAEFGGFSSTDGLVLTFQRRLRDILYTTTTPQEVIGRNVDTFFPYVQQWNSFSGNSGVAVGDNPAFYINLAVERNFIVDPILKSWIQLFNDILNNKPGLTNSPSNLPNLLPNRIVVPRGSITVDILPYEIPITSAILSASKALVQLKTLQFFDEAREYKTVLNFGNDKQQLVESWRTITNNSSSIQLKLVRPLNQTVELYQSASIVEEFAKTVIDTIGFELLPEQDNTPFLRPRNTNVGKFRVHSQNIKNVTLTSLNLDTGSVGNVDANVVSYDDRVFNRWYTSDFNSSELNINFSDYSNFVFFGSAEARLQAFANKLQKIQSYGTNISTLSSNAGERNNALAQEYIKRNFDPYEQFLYYASQSTAYSSSAYYVETGVEYNATGSWPKTNGLPLPYTSANSWFITQSAIAQRFDEFNPNYLIKHLPNHIQEDENSNDFIKFIQMFGHVMDNLKIYVDQFPNIYSTTPKPFEDLSMDQVYEVAKSFGLELPNAYSLESLQSFISSVYDGVGARSLVAETWKRFIHSSVYLRKLKGTRTGLDALLATYGINSPLVQVKESTYAVEGNYIKSDESVYALRMTGSVSSSIRLPFVSSSLSASNIQVRFLPELRQKSSLLTTDGTWGIDVVPHPSLSTTIKFNSTSSRSSEMISYFTITPQTSDYGRLEIISGSDRTVIVSSSYFPLFSDTYTHIMLSSQSQNLTIIQTDGDQILHQETSSFFGTNLINLWNSTFVYLGGTGSIRFNNFDGIIDDVRLWGEKTTADNFTKQAYDPGSYYGNTYSSSYNSLYVDLSFSQPLASITQSATNESPIVLEYPITELNPDIQWADGNWVEYPPEATDSTGWTGFQERVLTADLTTNPAYKVSDPFPSASSAGSTQWAAKIGIIGSRYIKNDSFYYIPTILGAKYKISGYAYTSGSTYNGMVGGTPDLDWQIGYSVAFYTSPSDLTETSRITQTVEPLGFGVTGWRYFEIEVDIDSANKQYMTVSPWTVGKNPYLLDENGDPVYGEPVCTEAEAAAGCPGFVWFTGLEIKALTYPPPPAIELPTTGFTTESYVRVLRTIKQFTPIVGSSIFSNRKTIVATPPVFSNQFIDVNGVKQLELRSSIKSVEEKRYVGGQDYVQFAVSPTDFINQTIIRSMGDIDTNYLIGSPKKYGTERYTELDDVFEFFLKNYNERINVNQYTRFFKNATKATSEYVESVIPARSKLVDGVVIESSILDRYKTYIQRSIKVDGSNTRTFEKFVAGSGSVDVGAYDFFAYYSRSAEVNTTEFTNPNPPIQKIGVQFVTSSLVNRDTGIGFVDATFDVISTVGPVSSMLSSKLPTFRQVLQPIVTRTKLTGDSNNNSITYVSSSIMDNNSSVGFLDSIIDSTPRRIVTQSGYPRNPYLGLRYTQNSQLIRIQSEVNTFDPIYEIKPVSDFDKVGTTTYFYKTSGLYWFPDVLMENPSAGLNKKYYRAKFNVPIGEIDSVLTRELGGITLLNPQYLTDYPGRFSFTIPQRTYTVGTPYKGVLNIANLISLYYLNGPTGIRIRLYSSQQDQDNDLSRSFSTLPLTTDGVLFDGLLDGIGQVFPYVLIDTDRSLLYFTVDNVSVSPITTSINFAYFEYEPANLAPVGYLAQHYKFTRTNNITDRRRSYLGCRSVYCPEGCPPDVTDPNNRIGRVLPRRFKNGTTTMPSLLLDSDSPVQVFMSPVTTPVVNNPSVPGSQGTDGGTKGGRFPADDKNRLT